MRKTPVHIARVGHDLARALHDRVDVGDACDVRDVHVLHIARAHAVAGHVDLARTERKPADRGRMAHPHRDVHAGPPHPGHQRRRIDRPLHVAPGRPAPRIAMPDPAAVVEGREAPGRIVHPGPAPGTDPHPVPHAVRRPAGRHGARDPHRAVLGPGLPAAMAVEVFDAGHLGRHVARGDAAVLARLRRGHPVGEVVALRVGDRVLRDPPFLPEVHALARLHRQRRAIGLVARLAGGHGGAARVVGTVEAVLARLQRDEAAFVGAEVELLRRLRRAQPRAHGSAMQAQAHAVVVETHHFHLGVGCDVQHGRADAHFDAAIALGGKPVAARHRPVAHRGDPFVGVGRVDPRLALHLGDAAGAARRVDLALGSASRQRRHRRKQQPDEEAEPGRKTVGAQG